MLEHFKALHFQY